MSRLEQRLVETACFRKRRDNSTKEQVKRLTVLVTRTDCRLSSNDSRYPRGFVYLELRILLKTAVRPVGENPFVVSARKRDVSKERSTSRSGERTVRDDKKRSAALFRASRDTTCARTSVNANLGTYYTLDVKACAHAYLHG